MRAFPFQRKLKVKVMTKYAAGILGATGAAPKHPAVVPEENESNLAWNRTHALSANGR